MKIPKEVKEKIKELFKDNEEFRDKLLLGDPNAIRMLIPRRAGIDPIKVVKAVESNDINAMRQLYREAKRMVELQELYQKLCLAYCKDSNIDR